MTEEELKKAAEEMGYKVFKKTPWEKLKRCPVCGSKPLMWGTTWNFYYECQNGCIRGKKGNRRTSRVFWNEEVEEYEG